MKRLFLKTLVATVALTVAGMGTASAQERTLKMGLSGDHHEVAAALGPQGLAGGCT